MALDLFTAEHGEASFTPNAKRSGPDGGVDGIFTGSIGNTAGPWKIAVAIRQTFAEVKKKVRHENKLAQEAGQRALFFITSYDATAVEADELTKLAKVGLKGSHVWARSKLERVLRDHTWVRQVYFGHQLTPGFVPLGHPSELDDPSQPDIELVGRSTERTALRSSIDGSSRIAVIVAAGGSGKTRLLRALPELLWGTQPRRSVWLRRQGRGTIDDAFLNGLPARKPIVITLDDAAQAVHELTELAYLAAGQSPVDVKLVVTIRAVDREATARALGKFRAAVTWIDLAEMSVVDATRIAMLECPALSQSDANRLARAFGSNLFLLRAAAQQVRSGEQPGTVVNDEHIRRLVASRLIEEAERHLASVSDQRDTLRLLCEVALCAPLAFDRISENEILAALHHCGVLRRVGDTLRFRRDVEGDLLLAYLLEQPAQRAIIERLFAAQSDGDGLQRHLRNLSAAGRGYAATMIRDLTQRWLSEPGRSLAQRIRLLPYCAEAAPEHVAELCINAAHARALTDNDIASIVLALGHSDAVRGLRLVWELAGLDVTMAPFSVNNVVKPLLNPCFHEPDELTAACVLIENWLRDRIDGRRAEVLAEVLLSLFATVAAWDTSDEAVLTMHELPLPASPQLLGIRRTATRLLGGMLSHSEISVRTRGLAVLARHGMPHLGRVTTQAFNPAAADEFRSLVPILDARLSAETEIGVLTTLYTILATRWATGRPAADDAARLLLGRKIEPATKAYHYGSPSEWFYSFDEAYAAAPANERWSWWVKRYLHNRSDAECARVVSDLCDRYRTAEEVAQCLSVIASAARPEPVIDAWCHREPALFEEVLRALLDDRARKYVENALRRERYRVNPSRVIADLQSMPEPMSLDDVNVILGTADLRDVAVAVALARHLVGHPDVAVRRRALDCIQYRDDADPVEILDVLEYALRDGDWGHHWDIILYVLNRPNRQPLVGMRPVLRERIEERFLAGKDWVGDDWHEERVLEILYGDDHERRLDLLGRLLANGTFPAIQEVGRLIAPLMADPGRFRCVVERFVRWVRDLGDRGLDILESVLRAALFHHKDLPSGAMALAMEMLEGSDTVARGVALALLTELQAEPGACAALARIAANQADELCQSAASALWSFRWPRRGWSRVVGQPPEELVRLQQVLREAQQLVKGDARGLVAGVLRDVEQALADYVRRDEEALLPR